MSVPFERTGDFYVLEKNLNKEVFFSILLEGGAVLMIKPSP